MTISGANIIHDMLMNILLVIGSFMFTSLETQVVVHIRYHALLFAEILNHPDHSYPKRAESVLVSLTHLASMTLKTTPQRLNTWDPPPVSQKRRSPLDESIFKFLQISSLALDPTLFGYHVPYFFKGSTIQQNRTEKSMNV